ncbi:MAG: beta-galactosidase, partial [Treponema sp.]|nr:beta-galactosidase [Treponema sp.]
MNYSYDRKSLLRTDADKNQSRWFPIMGEIHYSRYPDSEWRRELLKMKAGGVDIVSAYTIWIHHEEVEGEWDFSGCRDLRKFVSLIGDCGLTMMLRIGPWCHGEVRNGGFPDWLLKKCPENRCDNPAYLDEVRKFYSKLYEQVDGLLLKDGGPIIGVQIENEYGHCGGLSGAAGEAHMRSLTALAKEAGFDVPLYTATGWGGAVTAGLLPVMGGYCEAPWDPRVTEIEPSGNYLFSYERNDHAIGSDFGLGEGITFDMDKVPYLTAELGGGLQVTYKRRPVARAADLGAMSLVKLGSGCTLLGYYMY